MEERGENGRRIRGVLYQQSAWSLEAWRSRRIQRKSYIAVRPRTPLCVLVHTSYSRMYGTVHSVHYSCAVLREVWWWARVLPWGGIDQSARPKGGSWGLVGEMRGSCAAQVQGPFALAGPGQGRRDRQAGQAGQGRYDVTGKWLPTSSKPKGKGKAQQKGKAREGSAHHTTSSQACCLRSRGSTSTSDSTAYTTST